MAADTPPTSAATDPRPDTSIPPISYCRVFQVGAVCPKLCADCAKGAQSEGGKKIIREWNEAGRSW